MSVYDWRERMRERSRERMIKRLQFQKRDQTEQRLLTLDTLRDWSIISEDEFLEQRRALADKTASAGRAG